MCTVSDKTAAGVCVLTLTYGDRSALLAQVITSVAAEGVRQVLVLANGLAPGSSRLLGEVAKAALDDYGVRVTIYDSPTNLGSAGGYAKLIEKARGLSGVTGVWFLDDDNCPQPGSLAQLLQQTARYNGAAVSAVRTDRRYLLDAAAGLPVRPLRPGEVFGTDIRHLVRRIWRRLTARGRQARPVVSPVVVPYERVPYGGLFVPVSLLTSVAPPKKDFVIYADDYEYSQRLARAGGLYLVGAARIDDLEASWNASGDGQGGDGAINRKQNQSARLAGMNADFRLYYAVRNTIWLDVARVNTVRARLWFWLNLMLFMLPVVARAAVGRRWGTIKTLWRAVQDGRRGRLGLRAEYPLP